MSAKPPAAATLKRYGLSADDWWRIWRSQGEVCYVCHRAPPDVKLHTDHSHVRGFRRMRPEEKRRHVRGILCAFCNRRLVARGMTADKAQRIAEYLRAFADRSANDNQEVDGKKKRGVG